MNKIQVLREFGVKEVKLVPLVTLPVNLPSIKAMNL